MVLREIFDLNISFRTIRGSYIVNGLRKLNKDEFSDLLASGNISFNKKYIDIFNLREISGLLFAIVR